MSHAPVAPNMTASEAADSVLDPGVMSMLVLGAGLVSVFLDLPYTGMIFALGFAVLVPLSAMIGRGGKHREESDAAADPPTETGAVDESAALETLRERYARGEIDEIEYERRVENLLATESVGEAHEYVDRRAGTGDRSESTTEDRVLERERR